jgi:hypothetical protein
MFRRVEAQFGCPKPEYRAFAFGADTDGTIRLPASVPVFTLGRARGRAIEKHENFGRALRLSERVASTTQFPPQTLKQALGETLTIGPKHG